MRPAATSCSVTAKRTPALGRTRRSPTPARQPRRCATRIASSLTAWASPSLSRKARRMSRSPSGPGTRSPLACVTGFSHGVAWSAPASNARTIGAQPVGLGDDHVRQRRVIGQPATVRTISANTFHMPISPVPPPVGYTMCVGSRQPELLGDLDAHRLLALDAVRLAQRGDVEVPALRGERAACLPASPMWPSHQLQVGARARESCRESAWACVSRCVHAHRQLGRRRRTR